MSKTIQNPIIKVVAAVSSVILLGGCIMHVGANKANASAAASYSYGDDFSSVNKSLTISEGKSVGNASSVNGSLSLSDNVTAARVSSVNGRLKVGENVSADELSTVNGKLTAGQNLRVGGDVTTVNGKIELNRGSEIEGNVSSVNGKMELTGVLVEQNIETVNASIELSGNTLVKGDIVYKYNKKNKYSNYNRNPVLRIDSDVIVRGNIVLEREVDLEFENESLLDKVVRNYDE